MRIDTPVLLFLLVTLPGMPFLVLFGRTKIKISSNTTSSVKLSISPNLLFTASSSCISFKVYFVLPCIYRLTDCPFVFKSFIDAFELWCWRRLLRVPWTVRRSNQSILKEISPGCSLEGLMLKLKLQYFGHLIRRADSLEKTLMLGKIEGRRRRG